MSDLLGAVPASFDLPSVFDKEIFSDKIWDAVLKENKEKLLDDDWKCEAFFSLVSQRIVSSAQGQQVGYFGRTAVTDILT